jgi:hypothetical protein
VLKGQTWQAFKENPESLPKMIKNCNCGCQQNPCKCVKLAFIALLKAPLRGIRKIRKKNMRIIQYKYPLLKFETKPCFIRDIGCFLEKHTKKE